MIIIYDNFLFFFYHRGDAICVCARIRDTYTMFVRLCVEFARFFKFLHSEIWNILNTQLQNTRIEYVIIE